MLTNFFRGMLRSGVAAVLVANLIGSVPICRAQNAAPQPRLLHAQASTEPASHGLDNALQTLGTSATPLWIGYSVPVETSYTSSSGPNGVIMLEGDTHVVIHGYNGTQSSAQDHTMILFRVAAGKVMQLRSAGMDDTLDAGGLRFVWLTGVTPEDSVAELKALAVGQAEDKVRDTATFLISLHRSAAAVPALVSIAGPDNSLHMREKASFWLANQRGHEGFVAIQNFAEHDADAAFREKLTFDLTLSKDPGAEAELIRMAHDDAAPRVRQQAQFWMAQHGGKLVAQELRGDAEHDADAGVRKQAVFAISRLPHEQATAELCDLASTSHDPEVRKQAVFWLGQSNDPKALAYLTGLLTTQKR